MTGSSIKPVVIFELHVFLTYVSLHQVYSFWLSEKKSIHNLFAVYLFTKVALEKMVKSFMDEKKGIMSKKDFNSKIEKNRVHLSIE